MELEADQTVEIKAHCDDPQRIRDLLLEWGAEFLGCETQSDTFYNVSRGRLKLRQSESENFLIGYLRPDSRGPKHSRVNLYAFGDGEALDRALTDALGRRIIVKKLRERYLLKNVKFHLDRVEGLGTFMEIEVFGLRGKDKVADLRSACDKYIERLGIKQQDLARQSYADLLEKISRSRPRTEGGSTGD